MGQHVVLSGAILRAGTAGHHTVAAFLGGGAVVSADYLSARQGTQSRPARVCHIHVTARFCAACGRRTKHTYRRLNQNVPRGTPHRCEGSARHPDKASGLHHQGWCATVLMGRYGDSAPRPHDAKSLIPTIDRSRRGPWGFLDPNHATWSTRLQSGCMWDRSKTQAWLVNNVGVDVIAQDVRMPIETRPESTSPVTRPKPTGW
jgi:hypothetical protein